MGVSKKSSVIKILNSLDPRRKSVEFQRSMRNAVYSSANYLLLPILWLISTPVFVSYLGTDKFGIWMLVNTLTGLSGIMAFGLTDATIKFVSKYRAIGDEYHVVRVVRSTLTMYGILGGVSTILIFLMAPFLVNNVFSIGEQNKDLSIIAIQIGGFCVAIRFFDSVFQSTIFGYERYDLATRVTMLINVITIGVNVVLVLLGYGLVQILINTAAWLFVGGICKAFITRLILIRNLRFKPLFSWLAIKEILSYGFYSWLQGIGGILLSQADRLLVASFLGTTTLAYYAVCLQLSQQIHALLARAVSFMFPLSSAIKEKGDLDRLRRMYFKGLNITTIAAVTIGLPIFMCSHGILTLWMGLAFANQASSILRILVFAFSMMATSIVPHYYLNGTGFVRLNTLFGIISGFIVALAGLIFIPWFGLIGAAWSRITNTPTSIITRTVLHYKVLSDKRWYAGISIIMPVFITFAVGFGLLHFFGEPAVSLIIMVLMILGYALLGISLATATCLITNAAPRPVR